MVEGFLLGVIAASSLAVGMYFMKFWRSTGDAFFLSFGAAFLIEAVNRCTFLFFDKPNEASPWIYLVRLLSFLLILTAILRKNYS
jgi:hypothetical protein